MTLKYIIMGLVGVMGGFGILKNLCHVWEKWINRRSEEKPLKMKNSYEIELIKLKQGMATLFSKRVG